MSRSADSARRTARGPLAGLWRALKALARGILAVLTAPARPFRRSRRRTPQPEPVRIRPVPSYGAAERPSPLPEVHRTTTPDPRPPEPGEEPPPRRPPSRWSLVADWMGRSLIVLGMLTLLFVVYQIWGTNLVQAQEQRDLKSTLRDRLEAVEERPTTTTTTAAGGQPAPSTTTTTLPPPQLGEPIGLLEIPAIGVEQAFVEGTGRDELKKGPGHYPHSPLPGHRGNASLAGHRTTYGAPFMDLDRLEPGHEIVVSTVEGTFRYQVSETLITDPGDVSVVDITDDNRLTLTTCHPRYSARERLIVVAQLQGDPVDAQADPEDGAPDAGGDEPVELPGEELDDAPAGDDAPDDGDAPADGEGAPVPADVPATLDAGEASGLDAIDRGTALWTLALLAVGAAWWAVFRRRTRWYTWVAGVLPFLTVLFFFFGEVESLLPANY